jgi:hypothetical protein
MGSGLLIAASALLLATLTGRGREHRMSGGMASPA